MSGSCSLPEREVHGGMVSRSLETSVLRLAVREGERTCETLADFSADMHQQKVGYNNITDRHKQKMNVLCACVRGGVASMAQ